MSDFKFKRFSICHDRCAMKVGTDGVLLGAWPELPEKGTILDVGTGTGLVALMAAQRSPQSHITGIDIDEAATLQAQENVMQSPFAEHIQIKHIAFEDFTTDTPFDTLLCNPPFFEETLLSPNKQRNTARHTNSLTFENLIAHASTLLKEMGTFQVIIPAEATAKFRQLCFAHHLYLCRLTWVKTTERKAPKRVLLCFVFSSQQNNVFTYHEDTLTLTENGMRTAEYTQLTNDFYM